MSDGVTIWYRGARYELGRGPGGFGIWPVGGSGSQPMEQWPDNPDGWSAAWSRFTAVEVPGTISHLTPDWPGVAAAPGSAAAGGASAAPGSAAAGGAAVARRAAGPAALVAAGVVCGVIGLFPRYYGGTSLAGQSFELVPHLIYLAAWAVSAALILRGGPGRHPGTLLGLGTSLVTFGLFFADFGTVVAAGTHTLGAGLILGLVGWLGCTAGAALALRLGPAGVPRRPQAWRGGSLAPLAVGAVAATGAAIAFAPSWDRYTLRTPSGLLQSFTAGNSFSNPGLVIAGDVAVMAALVIVAVIAVLWQPIRLGAALLAGGIVPMVAQAISAVIQIGQPASPAAFGISPSQAAQVGLTISASLTPVFWIYCAFVAALIATAGWMLLPPRAPRPAGYRAPVSDHPSSMATSPWLRGVEDGPTWTSMSWPGRGATAQPGSSSAPTTPPSS